jgi:chemotaxis protein methyltransferase CheR
VRLAPESWVLAHALVSERLGLDIPEHRRADLEDALLQLVHGMKLRSPDALLARLGTLAEDAPEWSRLAEHLTIGETYFFRDHASLDALEHHILPRLARTRRRAGSPPRLSLWSAGCSTGEEAYSLAILLDRILPDASAWDLSILATDINPAALDAARRGVYRPWSLRDTPAPVRERYFEPHGGGYRVIPEIRQRVRFARLNLGGDAALPADVAPVDVILCRNVLMYLTRGVARRVVQRLQAALAPDGWLTVAAAEAWAVMFRPLVPANFPGAIFFTSDTLGREGASRENQAASVSDRMRVDAAGGHGLSPVPALPSNSPRVRRSQPGETPRESTGHDLAQARMLADRGDLQAALHLCQSVVNRDRLDVNAYVLLAAIHQERGDSPEALAALRRALYLDADCAEAHAAMGHLLLRRGETRRARRHLAAAGRRGSVP